MKVLLQQQQQQQQEMEKDTQGSDGRKGMLQGQDSNHGIHSTHNHVDSGDGVNVVNNDDGDSDEPHLGTSSTTASTATAVSSATSSVVGRRKRVRFNIPKKVSKRKSKKTASTTTTTTKKKRKTKSKSKAKAKTKHANDGAVDTGVSEDAEIGTTSASLEQEKAKHPLEPTSSSSSSISSKLAAASSVCTKRRKRRRKKDDTNSVASNDHANAMDRTDAEDENDNNKDDHDENSDNSDDDNDDDNFKKDRWCGMEEFLEMRKDAIAVMQEVRAGKCDKPLQSTSIKHPYQKCLERVYRWCLRSKEVDEDSSLFRDLVFWTTVGHARRGLERFVYEETLGQWRDETKTRVVNGVLFVQKKCQEQGMTVAQTERLLYVASEVQSRPSRQLSACTGRADRVAVDTELQLERAMEESKKRLEKNSQKAKTRGVTEPGGNNDSNDAAATALIDAGLKRKKKKRTGTSRHSKHRSGSKSCASVSGTTVSTDLDDNATAYTTGTGSASAPGRTSRTTTKKKKKRSGRSSSVSVASARTTSSISTRATTRTARSVPRARRRSSTSTEDPSDNETDNRPGTNPRKASMVSDSVAGAAPTRRSGSSKTRPSRRTKEREVVRPVGLTN